MRIAITGATALVLLDRIHMIRKISMLILLNSVNPVSGLILWNHKPRSRSSAVASVV